MRRIRDERRKKRRKEEEEEKIKTIWIKELYVDGLTTYILHWLVFGSCKKHMMA